MPRNTLLKASKMPRKTITTTEITNKKHKLISQQQYSELPQHLILTEILPKLPAKSLIRFKSVSKSWNSLISSTQFANSQLQSYLISPFSQGILLRHKNFEFIHYEPVVDNLNLDHGISNKINSEYNDPSHVLIGSCHGLLSFVSISYQGFESFNFVVYNPCIDQRVLINYPYTYEDVADYKFNFGFCYVSSLDDYLIVAIAVSNDPSCHRVFGDIYSLKSNSWTKDLCWYFDIKLMFGLDYRDYNGGGVLLGDNIHWWMNKIDNDKHIVVGVFDLVNRIFMYSIPSSPIYSKGACLWTMDKRLYISEKYKGRSIRIWVMKKYGVYESWTMLQELVIVNSIEDWKRICFGSINSSTLIFRVNDKGKLIVDDLSKNSAKIAKVYTVYKRIFYVELPTYNLGAVNFVQTLLSPGELMPRT